MALLNVSPTRMALMDLKRRKRAASRGHKLLKDKQDGLMQHFLSIIKEAQSLRKEIEERLAHAFRLQLRATSWMGEAQTLNALSSPQVKTTLSIKIKNILSVRIPTFTLTSDGNPKSYGYAGTNAFLDRALEEFQSILPDLVRLAELEKQAERSAIELETTRRRVNALEHKMIPDLTQTVKYIQMKLDNLFKCVWFVDCQF
jgi:V/A-type H+/Na+-transporting ATPase subunit D